jgi:hypothetical protein
MSLLAYYFQTAHPLYNVRDKSACNTYTSYIERNTFNQEFRMKFSPRQDFDPKKEIGDLPNFM